MPNSDLTGEKVSNLSNERYSQVLQHLQFKYDALEHMPDLVSKIKDEIEESNISFLQLIF